MVDWAFLFSLSFVLHSYVAFHFPFEKNLSNFEISSPNTFNEVHIELFDFTKFKRTCFTMQRKDGHISYLDLIHIIFPFFETHISNDLI